jgi:glycosyltransferase involved in cell wall biosynthesis
VGYAPVTDAMPLRILQIHTHYRQAGGEDGVVATELDLLRDGGHEVLAARATNPTGAAAAASFAGAAWNPAAAHRIRRVVERFRPDIAHVHNTWFALSPAVLSELHQLGIPVVMTLHNYRLICAAATLFRDGAPCHDCLRTGPRPAVAHRCYRDSLAQSAVAAATIALHDRRRTWHRDVERFIALTEFGRDRFVEGGLPSDRIEIKANSVGDPGPRRHPPSASRTVLYVGRLSDEKGVEVLLDAWARTTAELELVIVGTGPLEAELRRRARGTVRFAGPLPQDQVQVLMLAARALVFPSVCYEGQPLVPLEAAAAGLPVLLSGHGAMAGLFPHDAEPLLFSPGDANALGGRLDALLDDDFVDRFGALTRQRYETDYTHSVALHRLESVYRLAVRGGDMR